MRIPVLGDEDEPELAVVDGELRYHEHRFPLAPGSADDGADRRRRSTPASTTSSSTGGAPTPS